MDREYKQIEQYFQILEQKWLLQYTDEEFEDELGHIKNILLEFSNRKQLSIKCFLL